MEELIQKAQKGDEKAFTEIVINIKNDLYKIAKTRGINEEDIEDAIQETMIETYKSIKKLREPQKFKSWMIKILVNKCNKIYRKKYKKENSLEEFNLKESTAENVYKKVDDDIDFYLLIEELNYKEKITLVLYYKEDYSVKEISKILQMKENTVKINLFRAREKIKQVFLGGEEVERIG